MVKYLKPAINLVFLSISIFLSTYFLIQLSDNPYIRAGVAVFAIALEAAMQYVLALGKSHFRRPAIRKKALALTLFACYAAYILVYNIPSAVGFFVMEIDAQEQAIAKVERIETVKAKRLEQINATIDNLNRQLQAESETGYGSRSKQIMEQLERWTGEQTRLQDSLSTSTVTIAKVSRDVFRSLGDVTGIPADLLKIIIFSTSIAMLCLVLIITSWDLPDHVTASVTAVTPVNTGHVTEGNAKAAESITGSVTSVTEDVTPCACGCGRTFPTTPGRKYYEDSCRVAAFRSRRSG